ncbi:hypothetical protein ACFQMF_01680 [Halorubrum rutilum]|uniref:Uncharacterized protein n=1 Tax=Halorubrum rutilum TaxID=1364933 RepID=A0ABD6AH73_9EURY|nr:hypothetical protein [Halorubrum rutilum]
MAVEQQRVIEAGDLTDADRAILDELQEGARTKKYLIDQTGLHRNTVGNRLDVLEAGDVVQSLHDTTALYELVDDPRDDVDQGSVPEDAPVEYVVALETHIEAANEALDNDDPDTVRRHVRAAGDEVGEIRLLDEVERDA